MKKLENRVVKNGPVCQSLSWQGPELSLHLPLPIQPASRRLLIPAGSGDQRADTDDPPVSRALGPHVFTVVLSRPDPLCSHSSWTSPTTTRTQRQWTVTRSLVFYVAPPALPHLRSHPHPAASRCSECSHCGDGEAEGP